eukprot:s1900_g8.t2
MNLKDLTFGEAFNQSLETVSLPSSLKRLTLGGFNQSLDHVTFPDGLLTLTFGRSFSQPMNRVSWPKQLETLTFGEAFNQSLEHVSLPSTLKTLIFGDSFNHSFEHVVLPRSLESLSLGESFNQTLDNVRWPSSIQSLVFGDSFSQSLERASWPNNLQHLTFRGYKRLETAYLPGTLKSLDCNGISVSREDCVPGRSEKEKSEQVALLLLDAMHAEDAEEPDSLSWVATVNACGNAGEWHQILCLLEDFWEGQVIPDGMVYSAAIGSLSSSCSMWSWSLQLMDEMKELQLESHQASYGSLLSSMLSNSAWRQAFALYLDSKESYLDFSSFRDIMVFVDDPQCILLEHLGDTVKRRTMMAQRETKRAFTDVAVANAVGRSYAKLLEQEWSGYRPTGLTFAKKLHGAMHRRFRNGALPYNKELNLLARAVQRVVDGGTVTEAMEGVAKKRWRSNRLWFDMAGGLKAQLLISCLKGCRQVDGKVLELGTYCGYSAIRMASALPMLVETVEEDPLRVVITRCMIAMSNLRDRIKVWIGNTASVFPRLQGPFQAVFLDHTGKYFLRDLRHFQSLNLGERRAVIVANHQLKPAAPEFLWEVTQSQLTQVVSVPEFEQGLEDWMTITLLTRHIPKLGAVPPGIQALQKLSHDIQSRASDRRMRRKVGALEDWTNFVQEMKTGFGALDISATAKFESLPFTEAADERKLLTAGAVGVAAGTLGTWFEMSHGVFCIPVLTLPPLQLSHQSGRPRDGLIPTDPLAQHLAGMGRDDLSEKLRDFRDRYPIDDRASDFLEKVDREVLETVLAEFKPKREGEGNYSALVTNFVRSVQTRINRSQRGQPKHERSDNRQRRTRHRYDSSESSEDSFGRTRKPSIPDRRRGESSSQPRKAEVKAASEEESQADLGSLEELQKAVQRAQEELTRVEADARDEERLKVGKAEDAMAREVEEAVSNARDRFERELEQQLKEMERRLQSEMEQKIDDERQTQEEAAKVRKMELERDARQERERLIEEAERALRQKRKQVMLAQKKIDRAHQKAIAKAKQMVSSSEEPPKAKKVKDKEVKKDRRPACSEDSSLDYRRSRREKEQKETRPQKLNGRSGGERRDRRSSHSEESSERKREVHLAAYKRSGRSRSRSRTPLRLKTSRTDEGPTQRELDDFRDRYPIDSRAYGVLTGAPGPVQKSVLNQFRPKREGESDYSALVASFVRAVMHRHSQAQLQPRAANSLADFRERYPMDDRAFAVLERTSSGVQNTVLADFRPRREGESDYSALVMAFIRSIEARAGSTIDRGRGGRGNYRRDDETWMNRTATKAPDVQLMSSQMMGAAAAVRVAELMTDTNDRFEMLVAFLLLQRDAA